jgi:hypothetical protein
MIKLASRVAALTLTLLLTVGCNGDENGGPAGIDVRSFIAAVTTFDGSISAVFKTGSPPATSGGPAINVSAPGTVITGGSAQVSVSAGSDFTKVIVAIQGVEGYYEITIPNTTLASLLLTFASSIPQSSFNVLYKVATGGGAVSAEQVIATSVIEVGTGQVQVSVSWNTPTDVDLHVVEPSAEEIFYGNPTSATGGQLDLDSNAGCSLDNVNNENITWSPTAPRGQYTVRVDYWSACEVSTNTSYVVTVQVEGQQTKTFTGTFAPGDADFGAEGAGRTITPFSF